VLALLYVFKNRSVAIAPLRTEDVGCPLVIGRGDPGRDYSATADRKPTPAALQHLRMSQPVKLRPER
jgi:hypothetical protein